MPADPRPTRSGPAPRPGIVHLGPGAFFRAFNAIYTHEAMAQAGGDWGITAVSLKSPGTRDALAPQDWAYTARELGPNGTTDRLIESICRILVAPEDPEAVIATIADPATRIVSLTITEKGYGYDPATSGLDTAHPDVADDLAHPDAPPRSAAGFLTAALARRRDTGTGPMTVLSCDNLPSNGTVTRAVVTGLALAQGKTDLARWIEEQVPFPATMVDRITPATTEADIAALAEATGLHDPGLVVHEPFRQWVIEDDFAAGRPAWEAAGAQFVRSVAAHEEMKLRCLNGTHSTVAYLGYLAGHETIADCAADPDFAALCTHLWSSEILPTLAQPEGEDLTAYTDALLTRYRNPAIRHRTWQIAMDGSLKLPQRLLGTIRDRLDAGAVPRGLCLAVAGWMRYVGGMDLTGTPIDVRDPLADALRNASDSAADAAGKVQALLAFEAIFGTDLPAHPAFRDAVTRAYEMLGRDGVHPALRAVLSP